MSRHQHPSQPSQNGSGRNSNDQNRVSSRTSSQQINGTSGHNGTTSWTAQSSRPQNPEGYHATITDGSFSDCNSGSYGGIASYQYQQQPQQHTESHRPQMTRKSQIDRIVYDPTLDRPAQVGGTHPNLHGSHSLTAAQLEQHNQRANVDNTMTGTPQGTFYAVPYDAERRDGREYDYNVEVWTNA